MTHFLLIHGSWHGAWCWYKVTARLTALGHRVSVPNLPGRTRQSTAPWRIGVKTMTAACAGYLSGEYKTVVVAHSRYCIVASALAEAYPDRIERVIYLAAYRLRDGHTVSQYFTKDTDSLLLPHVSISKRRLTDRLSPAIYREGLYHDCSDEDRTRAAGLLCPEPLRPALAKVRVTPDRAGRVPTAYIRLTEDRAVSLALQDRLLNAYPVDRVESLQASHSAYFSQPDALVETIVTLSRD